MISLHRSNRYFLALALSAAGTLFGQDKPPAAWKGVVATESGVRVVKNPATPLFGVLDVDLEEDLSIGREDDENYLFASMHELDVDREGNIYVLDGGNFRIQKFDRAGKYLLTIGRKGQGPGEFESGLWMFVGPDGRVYLLDGRRIHIFDKNGPFVKSISFVSAYRGESIDQFGFPSEKGLLVLLGGFDFATKIRTSELALLDLGGKKLKIIFSAKRPQGWINWGRGGGSVSDRFAERDYLFPLADGRVVYARSTEYKLDILDAMGQIAMVIKKEEQPQPVTKAEKEAIVDRDFERYKKMGASVSRGIIEKEHHFPDFKPFLSVIFADSLDNIYVLKPSWNIDQKPTAGARYLEYDLFNKGGYYLYRVRLPFALRRIKDGYGYRSEGNIDSGEYKVKRYRIKNWDKLSHPFGSSE